MENNYRYDPFLNVATPLTITNEGVLIPATSPYEARLIEVPLKETPSTITARVKDYLTAAIATTGATSCAVEHGSWFAINDVIAIDSEKIKITNIVTNTLTITRAQEGTTAATHADNAPVYGPYWTEVAATPAALQFWPDYSTGADEDEAWNTGLMQFNSSDAGKGLVVSYKGTGTLVDINSALAPTGKIGMFARNTAPPGWIKANGALLSRAAYHKLFTAIGTTFGVGDETSTFALPELRGEFIRCWDDSRGIDAARGIGTFADPTHTHVMSGRLFAGNLENYYVLDSLTSGASKAIPRNVAMLACIKY